MIKFILEHDIMIENNIIDLSQSSTVRMDARNTIKYTLLLDYSAPLFKDDISKILVCN